MAKRRAGTELTDRNWQDDDAPEEVGTFEVADKDILARRVIKKAKRRIKPGDSSAPQQDDAPKPSPFAGFAFGGNKPSAAAFAFKSTTTNTSTAPSFSFKPSVPEQPKPAVSTATETPRLPTFGGLSSTPAVSTNGAGVTSTVAAKTQPGKYITKLQNLNRSVSAWIQKHVNENPVCDLTPVFEDYKKHLQEIEKLQAESASETPKLEEKSTKTTTSSSPTPTFSFGKTNTSSDDKAETSTAFAPTTSSTFSFGKKPASDPPKADFSFKVAKEKPASDTTSETTSGFSFGKSSPSAASSSSGMASGSLFGSSKPFSFSGLNQPAAPGGSESKGEEEYVPPKEEVKTVQEKDSLYSKRCKLFYKKDGSFKDRGVGMLHLKKTGTSLQMLVRADTNLGNVLLNVMVPESLPVSRQGKNNLLLMTPMNPPVDRTCPQCNKKYPKPQESNVCDSGCTATAVALLIRVKTAEDADEAFEKINKLRES